MGGVAYSAVQLKQISIRGVVQGVGFRPFVYRLAHEHGLTGWVLNHSGGVEIEVEGLRPALEAFIHDLVAQAPPLARIVAVEVRDAPPNGYTHFEIRHSVAEEGRYQLISPDIATCSECVRELLDPADRRYRYPFTNCTNCGPRFTIIRDIPYDRRLTTMQPFSMCAECQREYDDPLDRRFHAQPNACPVCGPHLWLEMTQKAQEPGEEGRAGSRSLPADLADQDVIAQAAHWLQAGLILAIKGLGGFHLACDATNRAAVQTLRSRKARPAKPLAVMMDTLDEVLRHCYVSEAEQELLTSPQCPIVLLRWRDDSTVVREVAPGNLYLGVMLPYTPLHHLLLREMDRPLVMTSGNLSEEPIAQDNDEARCRLGSLADAFLMHNRDIHARYDDSVVLVVDSLPGVGSPGPVAPSSLVRRLPSVQMIRRARGYAPFPIRLPFPVRQILAVGAELKNTFCLTRDDFAFVSQHIGDMENVETFEHFEATIALYRRLFRIEPEIIAYDSHPDYFPTHYALSTAQDPKSKIPVQHHHAHIAACLADNGWSLEDGEVIGVAWDGTGYGLDGRIWGGEFFTGGYHGFRRVAHLEYLPMPGGEAAIRNPWRLALGYVLALTGETPDLSGLADREIMAVRHQVEHRLNTPYTSAMGRLFDAVAALLGVRHCVSYEAQAAIELEMLATRRAVGRTVAERPLTYPYELEQTQAGMVIRLKELLKAILSDHRNGIDVAEIGWRFHHSLAEMLTGVCCQIADETGLRTVALSGGCFQNRLLLALSVLRLEEAGFQVLLHRQAPCNDGGVSLGQAVLAHFASREQ